MSTSQTPTDDATSEVLQMDDAVDDLTEFEVIDVFVRGQFMQQIIGANERGGNRRFRHHHDCDDVQELLTEGSGSAIMQAASIGLGLDHPVSQQLGWENGEGNARTLFDRLTNTDMDTAKRVRIARKKIKETLRGCGMRRMKVTRNRVAYHIETSGATTGGEA